ncbi:MAG: hypothetical protein ACKOFB_05865 [bacterium]
MDNTTSHAYRYKVDFYWKSLAMYGAALMMYAVLKGTIEEKTLSITLTDPIVILLACFVLISSLSLIVNHHARRVILINDGSITFQNRYRSRTFTLKDIRSIILVKDKRFRVNTLSAIKIGLHGRRRPLRLRPSLFEHEESLIQDMKQLKQKLHLKKA